MTTAYVQSNMEESPRFAVMLAGQYLYSVSKYDVRLTDENYMKFRTIHGAKCMADAVRNLHGLMGTVVEVED